MGDKFERKIIIILVSNKHIIESIYRRLLSESAMPDISNLAVKAEYNEQGGDAILFKVDEESLEILKGVALNKLTGTSLARDGVIVGMISISKSSYPCWDAFEVNESAGPGYGKILYGLAFAMSPSGRIMSDRNMVSKAARAGWAKASQSRTALQFDDVGDPKTSSKEDDCEVYTGKKGEILNVALEEQGWERAMLDKLVSRGEQVIDTLTEKLSGDATPQAIKARLELALRVGSGDFFDSKYYR